jgi:hypothetical protein
MSAVLRNSSHFSLSATSSGVNCAKDFKPNPKIVRNMKNGNKSYFHFPSSSRSRISD